MPEVRIGAVGLRWRPAPRVAGRGVTIGILVAVVIAWIAVIAMLASGAMHHGPVGARGANADAGAAMARMPGMANMPGMAGMPGMAMAPGAQPQAAGHDSMLLDSGTAEGILMWSLMVVAMMLPTALPAVRHVAVNSLRWRQRRAMATFVAVYVSMWVAFGTLLVVVSPLWSAIDTTVLLALGLAVAAGWQMTASKRRALRDCHRPSPLPPHGLRATVGVVRFALVNGLACVRSCWAMMFAMGIASSMMIFWMVAITGIVTTEKLARKPRQAIRASAALLAVGALVTGASALIA
jgi:predicted metal-binding membrane protein